MVFRVVVVDVFVGKLTQPFRGAFDGAEVDDVGEVGVVVVADVPLRPAGFDRIAGQ